MANFALLGVLAGARLGLALAEASCEWVDDADKCTAVAHLVDDTSADSLLSDAGTCIANTAEGMRGCMEDLPECQAVSVSGLASFGICVPTLAVLGAIDVSAAESLFQIENCAGIATPECDEVRANYYGLLGCPECIDEANTAAALEATCAAVASAADCGSGDSTAPTDDTASRSFDGELVLDEGSTAAYDDSPYADEPAYVEADPTSAYGEAYGEAYVPEALEPEEAFVLPELESYAPGPEAYDSYYSYNYLGLGDEPASAPEVSAFAPSNIFDYYGAYEPVIVSSTPLAAVPFAPSAPFAADPPYSDAYAEGAYNTDTYYDAYGDYPAPYGDVPTGAAISPLELGEIDVAPAFAGAVATPVEDVAAEGPEGLTAGDVREFLGPVLNDDSDADAPATILLEPFAAAGPGRLASAAMQSLALLAAALCMLA